MQRVSRGAVLLTSLFIGVQVLVPTLLLFQPRAQRFGWHMYSTVPDWPSLSGVTVAGARVALRRADFIAFERGDLDARYLARLPHHVCALRKDLNAVELSWRSRPRSVIVRCQ